MTDVDGGGFKLTNLASKNVILGKNGCGKSYLLKEVERSLSGNGALGEVRYISPERGGLLVYEPGIEQAIVHSKQWMPDSRRVNQSGNFRQQSAALFRRLELMVLREIERTHTQPGYVATSFGETVEKLNFLLDRVRLVRDNRTGFRIALKEGGADAAANTISSGESELISLGIEFLSFAAEADPAKSNFLLVDEPDVHLHPDLQARLAEFIIQHLDNASITLVLATHSTALLAGLAEDRNTRVAFMRQGDTELKFKTVSDTDRLILPIFGAHPLSNVFNQAPILLIEGEDDERVWQQAMRSAQGKIRVFPCPVEGIDRLAEFEVEVNSLIEAVYDNARGYSLRDRDLSPTVIDDLGNIIRMRLSCRAAENLMLSDDALRLAGTDWMAMQAKIHDWTKSNTQHRYYNEFKLFVDGGLSRKDHDLKEIRNILIGLITNKPWEVLVGQAIAKFAQNPTATTPNSLRDYLGEKLVTELLL